MTTKEMRRDIIKTTKSARQSYKATAPADSNIIDINYSLPYVAVNCPNSEYFFQGDDASNLLKEATNTGNKFNVSVEDAIIWQSQGW